MAGIEGKVAKILNVRELAINKGTASGVQVGMRFAILNRQGGVIRDPDTGEPIGTVELPKTIVKVVAVQERLAVARTFRTYTTPGGPLYGAGGPFSGIARMMDPPITTVETLRTDESTLREELDEDQSYVKVGDQAVEIIDEEQIGLGDYDD